jgi:flavin-dependent dehydrogenase
MGEFDYDIIIVGSGPAGVSTWLHLHQLNPGLAARTLVLEKAQHPRPKLCGGGVTRAADARLERLHVRIDVPDVAIHAVEFRYRGRRFYWRQRNYFRVVRRREFDAALVRAARQRGMLLREQEAVRGLSRLDGGWQLETGRAAYRSRVVVGADGANSVVRSQLGIQGEQRIARLIEILTPANPATAPEFVSHTAVFEFDGVDRGLQGYAWDFPCRDNGAAALNRGIYDSRTYPHRPRADLRSLFRAALQARAALNPGQVWQGHPLRWFHPRATFAQPHAMLVGDAAGVDPFAGEGISFALQYGDVAASQLAAAFDAGDFTFARYPACIMAHELGRGLNLRRFLARLAYPGWPPVMFTMLFRVMGRLGR